MSPSSPTPPPPACSCAPAAISSDADANCPDASANCSDTSRTPSNVARTAATALLSAPAICPTASDPRSGTCCMKSPAASAFTVVRIVDTFCCNSAAFSFTWRSRFFAAVMSVAYLTTL